MPKTYTAFLDDRRLASGPLEEVLAAVRAQGGARALTALVFEDETGELIKPGAPPPGEPEPATVPVRLLPRHLAWLERQPGGPAAAIRRLIDQARRNGEGEARRAQDAAYEFISMTAGDRPGFEAATRALYAGDGAQFDAATASWPADLAGYGRRLAGAALSPP